MLTPGGDGERQPDEVVVEHHCREFVGQLVGRLPLGDRRQKRPRFSVGHAKAIWAPTLRNFTSLVTLPKLNVAGSIPVARSLRTTHGPLRAPLRRAEVISPHRAPMPDRTLYVLPVSPWSASARWALDHHGLAYRTVVHVPFLGEPRLRLVVGRRPGRATVPVLVEGGLRLTESVDIARHADRLGGGAPLFPPGRDADVLRWVKVAHDAMSASRGLVPKAMLDSDEALDEALPVPAPGLVRALARPVTRYATRWFAEKYNLDLDDVTGAKAGLRAGLDALREGLRESPRYLLGEFSFADIATSGMLQAVKPVEHPRYPLPPATRRAWAHDDLAEEYGDLVAWRDALYRDHRG